MLNWFKSESKQPQTLGQIGEELAQLEYKKRGYKIVAANFFNKQGLRKGEIDFIAADKKSVVFVEVKTRSNANGKFGTAEESVNQFKQIKLLKAVKLFLLKYPSYQKLVPSVDVCVILIENFNTLKLVQTKPDKYLANTSLDKVGYSAKIIANAVEDWN